MSSEPRPEPDTGHDYDGIREFDNPLPGWWLTTFYATILFGFGYWLYYQAFGGPSVRATLMKEEQAALEKARKEAANAPLSDQVLLTLSQDKATHDKAQVVFLQVCAACHKPDGSGSIGPNLTDEFWIHGDKPTEIYKTIATGVVAKGMPAWEPLLGPEKIKLLASYICSLKHTNLPGKPPEGQKVQ